VKAVANESYLAELILSIHNEVQTAVDYIGSAASQAGTELGKNEAIMQIENLRVKLPFQIQLESKNLDVGSTVITPVQATAVQLRQLLSTRKGFMLDLAESDVMANFTKVRVDLQPNQASETSENVQGELEIVFSPLQRR